MSRSAKFIGLSLVAAAALFVFAPASAPAKQKVAAHHDADKSAAKPAAKLGVGRVALPEEVAAWDTDVRPDGQGLPPGKGTAKQGDEIFQAQCASCHGEFGQGVGRWPVLAGGLGTLKAERPDKTVGSYWPDVSTVYDYVQRAMPFGNARSLSHDELYSVVAYILMMNDVIKDENLELNEKNLATIKLPNAANFFDDDREVSEKAFWKKDPCMKNCKAETPKVLGRAANVDVTPDEKSGPKVD
ncbi:MAG: cytochrome c [Rhizobiales bacterium]|jgi:cytochrome c|nr:cytochrome c [Hyphomicrobiales bacterium]